MAEAIRCNQESGLGLRNRDKFGSRGSQGWHDAGQSIVRLPSRRPADGAGSCRDYLVKSDTSSVVSRKENNEDNDQIGGRICGPSRV